MSLIKKIRITPGISWIEIPDAEVFILCGCPADTVKHLIKNGIIKTVEKDNFGTLIKTPYEATFRDRLILKYGYDKFSFFRKLISFLQFILSFPLFYFDNKKEIYKAAEDFLRQGKVDLIIATGEPFILHKYAHLLSKFFNTPYALAYRDEFIASTTY